MTSYMFTFSVIFSVVLGVGGVVVDAFCPPQCECDDTKLSVVCIKAGLVNNMPNSLNPALKTLVYKYNKFPKIDVSIKFLSRLHTINFSHNEIETVPDKIFSRQSRLHHLNLESNVISHLTTSTFVNLETLKTLNMRSNHLERLESNVLSPLSSLEMVDFGGNKISFIDDNAFKDAKKIKIIHMESNQLTSIPSEALSHLPDLTQLYLSRNPLKIIASDLTPMSKTSLQTLDLTSCQISSFDGVKGLGRSLNVLNLSDNELKRIPKFGDEFVHVKHLNIGQNPLTVIEPRSFSTLENLEELSLSGCDHLESIERFAFSNLQKLQIIKINFNPNLSKFDPKAFHNTSPSSSTQHIMSDLKEVQMIGNNLKTISQNLLPWSQLTHVDLKSNPWDCTSCELLHMSETAAFERGIRCATPLKFKHEPYNQLPRQFVRQIAAKCSDMTESDPHDGVMTRKSEMLSASETGSVTFDDVDQKSENDLAILVSVCVVIATLCLACLMFVLMNSSNYARGCKGGGSASSFGNCCWCSSRSGRSTGSNFLTTEGGSVGGAAHSMSGGGVNTTVIVGDNISWVRGASSTFDLSNSKSGACEIEECDLDGMPISKPNMSRTATHHHFPIVVGDPSLAPPNPVQYGLEPTTSNAAATTTRYSPNMPVVTPASNSYVVTEHVANRNVMSNLPPLYSGNTLLYTTQQRRKQHQNHHTHTNNNVKILDRIFLQQQQHKNVQLLPPSTSSFNNSTSNSSSSSCDSAVADSSTTTSGTSTATGQILLLDSSCSSSSGGVSGSGVLQTSCVGNNRIGNFSSEEEDDHLYQKLTYDVVFQQPNSYNISSSNVHQQKCDLLLPYSHESVENIMPQRQRQPPVHHHHQQRFSSRNSPLDNIAFHDRSMLMNFSTQHRINNEGIGKFNRRNNDVIDSSGRTFGEVVDSNSNYNLPITEL